MQRGGFFVLPARGDRRDRPGLRRPRAAPPRRPRGAHRGSCAALGRARPGARRRHRHRAPGGRPDRRRLRRPRARGLQREPLRHAAATSSTASTRATSRAGCDVVETNSFGGTPLVLAEYGLADRAFELNRASAAHRPRRLRAGTTGRASRASSPAPWARPPRRSRSPAASPSRSCIEHLPRPGARADGRRRRLPAARDRAGHAQRQGRPDRHRARVRSWRAGACRSRSRPPSRRPARCSAGRTPRRSPSRCLHADLLYVGLNCATGPELMTDHLRTLSEICRTRVACVPNAGLPDEEGRYTEGPEVFVRVLRPLPRRRLAQPGRRLLRHAPRPRLGPRATWPRAGAPRRHPAPPPRAWSPGSRPSSSTDDNRPLLVGERTNVLGSRKFKRLIAGGAVRGRRPRSAAPRSRRRPDPRRLPPGPRPRRDRGRRGLPRPARAPGQGAADDRLDRRRGHGAGARPTARARRSSTRSTWRTAATASRRSCRWRSRFGAALIVGLIDEKGMAVTRRAQARGGPQRSFQILTEEMGMRAEDIWWDPLVFPCGTGDAAYLGSAAADHRGGARGQGAVPGDARPSSASPTSASACRRPAARCSTRSSSTTAPRPASTRPSSTPRSSRATPTSRRRSASSPRR